MKKFDVYYYDRYGLPRVETIAAKSRGKAVIAWNAKHSDGKIATILVKGEK